jgi:HK97 family phage major capsid protein
MNRIAELRQNMAATHAQIEGILAKSREEKRGLNTEETAAFDKAAGEITGHLKAIEAEERSAEVAAKLQGQAEERAAGNFRSVDEQKAIEKNDRELFTRAFLLGPDSLAADEYKQFRSMYGRTPILSDGGEQRAQVVGTTTAGGFTVPQDFWNQVQVAMKDYTGVIDANPFILNTDNGRALPIPNSDDTGTLATLIAENTAATDVDVAFTQTTMNAYKWTTGLVKISSELLQDSGVDIESFIQSKFGERLGRGWNLSWTTGTGSSQPQGVVTGSVLGVTAAAAVAFTSNEILDLIHSVDPAYRNGARLMFHDTTLKAILKLADTQNRPLFQPSYRDAAPATIHGYPFSINQDMAVPAAAAKFMLFGNFQNYWIRRVRALDVRRLVERYAESDVIAFVGFARMDAKLIDAGKNPIKYMRNA